jgi:hypothetical protein
MPRSNEYRLGDQLEAVTQGIEVWMRLVISLSACIRIKQLAAVVQSRSASTSVCVSLV